MRPSLPQFSPHRRLCALFYRLPLPLLTALAIALHVVALHVVAARAQPVIRQAAAPRSSVRAPVVPAASLLPAPQVAPQTLSPGGIVTLTLPPNFPLSATRLRVGLFEAGRPARVADALRDFTLRAGRLQTTLAVEADPGLYELRLISNDRARTPISQGAPLLVPGVDREPGWWLLNGSPFVEADVEDAEAENDVDANAPGAAVAAGVSSAPFFVPGLRRGARKKELSRNIPVPSGGPLRWKTLPLPPLREMLTPGYDFAALRAGLTRELQAATASGQRNYLGFLLPAGRGDEAASLPATAPNAVNSLRRTLSALSPTAALILSVDATRFPGVAARDIGLCAALCDAVVIGFDPGHNESWPIKTTRRVAEEQPEYDLPIFVRLKPVAGAVNRRNESQSFSALVDVWMAGATGVISGEGEDSGAGTDGTTVGRAVVWRNLMLRNAPLFVGSVTLEDIGLLPGESVLTGGRNAYLYSALRDARRIPLLARLTRGKKDTPPESLVVALGESVSSAMIERLRLAANDGARIYIEGAPLQDENERPAPWRMGALVGGDVKPLGGDDAGRSAAMILQDGWMFGTGRGTRVAVRQSVTVMLRPGTIGGQAKSEKGRDVLTGPRVAARLEDGSPALIINPVGKGEVIWMPHLVLPDESELRRAPRASGATPSSPSTAPAPVASPGVAVANAAQPAPATRALDAASINIDRSTPLQRYYAAVAAYVQPGLVSLRGVDRNLAGAESVRVALRRSAKGTPLLALFNAANRPAAVAAGVDGVAGVALDLATERALPLSVRGFQSEVLVTIPARGWKLIAFGASRKALDDERNAPRLRARLR